MRSLRWALLVYRLVREGLSKEAPSELKPGDGKESDMNWREQHFRQREVSSRVLRWEGDWLG